MLSPKVPLTSPCHCGSGRKYRNCCWKKEKREYAIGRSAISDAISDVMYLVQNDIPDDVSETANIVFDDLYYYFSSKTVEDVMRVFGEPISICIEDACACDLELDNGNKVIDLYLQKKKDALHPMAMEFLTGWKHASLSFYEIQKVNFRESLLLKDLFTRKMYLVTESRLSQYLNRWDTFFARIIPLGNEFLLGPSIIPIIPLHADFYIKELREIRRTTRGSTTLTWKRFFKKHWYIIPQVWLEQVASSMGGPKMHNTDGDPINMFRLTFTLQEGSSFQVNRILSAIPGMQKASDKSYNYVVDTTDRKDTALDNVLVANLEISETSVEVEVNSENRAERIIALLEEHLAEFIEEVEQEAISFDPEAFNKKINPEFDALSPELKDEMMMQFLDDHYTKWIDTPLPALNGTTPRESMKTPKMRKALTLLLKDMEAQQTASSFNYDLSWLWEELGLERP
ncbi:MAG: SEC-C domain-containing protein [Candidatus Aegiribacteria sp.]|nr:SEC-C domain-containing protein [Candidatus Aegiribacteria sp.]